jgi:hypothetical protein
LVALHEIKGHVVIAKEISGRSCLSHKLERDGEHTNELMI